MNGHCGKLLLGKAMLGLALLGTVAAHTGARAQVIEDHSLPKSVVKTYHVKCEGGRLGMLRYDTRNNPVRLCASVQDGSRPQRCADVALPALDAEIRAQAAAVCRG